MNKHRLKSPNAWLYFAVTFIWSWVFWFLMIVFDVDFGSTTGTVLYAFGGIGPMVAGISLTYLSQDRETWLNYWRRVCEFRRIKGWWWVVTLFTYPILNTFAMLIYMLTTGNSPVFGEVERFFSAPLSFITFALLTLVFGPIPEELGWRGCALPGLQSKRSALSASLILGAFWALWHLPQFFINGTFQNDVVGFGTTGFWIFMVAIVTSSILYTWIFNYTHYSTLSAILFHFSVNFSGELFDLPTLAYFYQLLLVMGLALLVSYLWRDKMLTKQRVDESKWG